MGESLLFYCSRIHLDTTGIPLPPGLPTQSDNNASDPGSDVASAVEKQLGLKLTSTKGKLDVIVVDRAEKIPTENRPGSTN